MWVEKTAKVGGEVELFCPEPMWAELLPTEVAIGGSDS